MFPSTPSQTGGSGPSRAHLICVVLLVTLVGGCGAPRERFAGSFPSPEALARAYLGALEARDEIGLQRLALSEEEYRLEFLPEMFVYGKYPTAFIWEQMKGRSQMGLWTVLGRLGGRSLTFEDIVFTGGTVAFQTFRVHQKPQVHVVDRMTGRREALVLFGSVLEHDGGYKLLSFNLDR